MKRLIIIAAALALTTGCLFKKKEAETTPAPTEQATPAAEGTEATPPAGGEQPPPPAEGAAPAAE